MDFFQRVRPCLFSGCIWIGQEPTVQFDEKRNRVGEEREGNPLPGIGVEDLSFPDSFSIYSIIAGGEIPEYRP